MKTKVGEGTHPMVVKTDWKALLVASATANGTQKLLEVEADLVTLEFFFRKVDLATREPALDVVEGETGNMTSEISPREGIQ